MKRFIPLFLIVVFLASCAATNDLTIRVTEPAPISLPADVTKVGVVNRTNSTVDKNLQTLDKVLSIELNNVDSSASLKALQGIYEELQKNSKFTDVKYFNNIILDNNAIGVFSGALPKNVVADMCDKNNLDAVFVLEYFDTDTKVDYSAVPVQTTVLGVTVDAVETQATVNTAIKLGWRIYDYSGSVIYDEYAMFERAISTGRGINPLKAISAVTGQRNVVEQVSYNMGQKYAIDLLPYSVRVHRIYYVRGSDNFKIGKRLARAGQWDQAADYWKKDLNNSKRKVAGRAHYNMAIINEINGDIDAAMEWAEKSYTIYNNKKGLYYLNTLKNRKARMQELARQQGTN